jgi:hypothetical protein
MTARPFSELPDDARLWAFPTSRPLRPDEAEHLLAEVDRFIDSWEAHGHPVQGGRELREDRFLLIAADERASGVSGCSIDTLFRRLQTLERELGVSLTDVAPIWYRDKAGEIHTTDRAEFRALAQGGAINADSIVFDPTVATVGDLRDGRFETPAGRSWHARLLGAPPAR